jgi:hypothetical protein
MMRLVVWSFTLVLLFSSGAFGQFLLEELPFELLSYDFIGSGARAKGMGNAFIAVSNDASAASWNPAGLVSIEEPLLGFGMGNLAPRGESAGYGKVVTPTSSFTNVSGVSFVAPVRIKGQRFVGALTYANNSEEYMEYGIDITFDTLIPELGALPVQVASDQLVDFYSRLNSVNVAAATQIMEDISMGVSINVYTGSAIRNINSVSVVDSAQPEDVYPQYVTIAVNTQIVDTVKYSGYNLTVGLKYDGDRFDAGLRVMTPFDLEHEIGQSLYNVFYYNGLTREDMSDTVFFDNLMRRYEMPWFIGGGVAIYPTEDLLLAVDAEYRGFGSSQFGIRDSAWVNSDTEFWTDYDPQWYNVFTFRMGAEYTLRREGWIVPEIPFRAGFGYVPLPVPDLDMAGNRSQATSYNLSAGMGVHWPQIHLDLAYVYNSLDSKDELRYLELKSRSHRLALTFTGYF